MKTHPDGGFDPERTVERYGAVVSRTYCNPISSEHLCNIMRVSPITDKRDDADILFWIPF
jgi:hypothetical protein